MGAARRSPIAGRPPVPPPNPDLSLRFACESEPVATLVASARLERISTGLAQTRIEVWSGECLVATGISSSTLLAGAWPDATRSARQSS